MAARIARLPFDQVLRRVVWGWSVNEKKARIRDVGVVIYKDTPRKVVGYRTPAQMVNFRIPSPKLRNSFYGLLVMVAAMCVKRSSEGWPGCFRLLNYLSGDVCQPKGVKRNGRNPNYWNNKISFEFLIQNCKNIMNGLGGLVCCLLGLGGLVCCCVDWAAWFVVVWLGLPGLHLSSNGFRIIP